VVFSTVSSIFLGVTVTNTVKTSNVITTNLELVLSKEIKLDIDHSLTEKSAKNLKLGAEYKHCFFVVRSNVDVFNGPVISSDITLGYFICFCN
jgi:hypothetical protein